MQQNVADRLFGWWYAIAAPPAVSQDAPLQQRDFVRKGRIVSIILLVEMVLAIITLGVNYGLQVLIPVVISLSMMILGVILNRLGKTRTAGIIVLVVVETGMVLSLLATAFTSGGLQSFGLIRFASLVQPELIAITLFSAYVALPLTIFNCIFTVLAIMFLPKTAGMMHDLSVQTFDAYFGPLSVQVRCSGKSLVG